MDALLASGALWYTSRATGLVSLLMLTAVVLLGILVNRGGRLPGLPRFAVTGLHRNVSLLSVVFLAVHVLAVVVDPYVTIGWAQAVLPWGAGYEPVWVGLGTVALDLILALVVTSLIRLRMPAGTWRAVHWLAYAAWPIAVGHGLGAGTDLRSGWMLWTTVAMAGAVGLAAGWRAALAMAELPRAERAARLLNAGGTHDAPAGVAPGSTPAPRPGTDPRSRLTAGR